MSSLLNLNDGAAWNYSNPDAEGYMPSITGTIVEINEVQSVNYKTKSLETWDDGNPKLNIQFIIQGQTGKELPFTFNPKGIAADAVKAAIKSYDPNASTMAAAGGLMVRITTQGRSEDYGPLKPRPWWFEILGPGAVPFRGVHEFQRQPVQQQAQPKPQPAMQQATQAPPIVNGYYAAPTAQQQVPPSPLNRPINQQPQQPQPMAQQPQPAMQQPMQQPQPMAQQPQPAMQQPMQQPQYEQVPMTVYDQDIPF